MERVPNLVPQSSITLKGSSNPTSTGFNHMQGPPTHISQEFHHSPILRTDTDKASLSSFKAQQLRDTSFYLKEIPTSSYAQAMWLGAQMGGSLSHTHRVKPWSKELCTGSASASLTNKFSRQAGRPGIKHQHMAHLKVTLWPMFVTYSQHVVASMLTLWSCVPCRLFLTAAEL